MSGQNRAYFVISHNSIPEIAMVNQNLFEMKQPELGKKISEMRKAKGLTQEELVEMCNLNVRTIQRIEAGEVTPRSYTIKALFEALGMDPEEKESIPNTPLFGSDLPTYLKKLIHISFVSGILYFLISIVEFPLDMNMMNGSLDIDFGIYLTIKLASIIFYSIFMIGFLKIATHSKNLILRIATWLMIIASLVGTSIELFLVNLSGIPFSYSFGIPYVASFGIVYLIFGFGLTRFNSPWKSFAFPLGVLGMVTGFLFITVLGAILGAATQVVFDLGLLYFLIGYVKKSRRVTSPDSTFNSQVTA